MTHWIKFQRAHEHLNEIEAIVKRFLDMKPYRLVGEYDPKPPYRVNQKVNFRMWFHAPAPIPESLPRIVGDCLTNLRASLDHLVYSIAVKHTGRTDIDETFLQFAIYDDPGKFASWRGKLAKPNLLPDAVRDYIEGKQPYKGHDPAKMSLERHCQLNPLWVLNVLVNADKHRTLNTVTQIRVTSVQTKIEGGSFAGTLGGGMAISGAFQHGDPMVSLAFTVREPAVAKVHVDSDLPADVAFGREWPGTGKGVRGTLQIIRDYIRDVVFTEMEDQFM